MIKPIAFAVMIGVSGCSISDTPISETAEHIARNRLAAQCDDFGSITGVLDSRIEKTAGSAMNLTLLLEYERVAGTTTDICRGIVDTVQPGLDAGIVERNVERIEQIEEGLFLELPVS